MCMSQRLPIAKATDPGYLPYYHTEDQAAIRSGIGSLLATVATTP